MEGMQGYQYAWLVFLGIGVLFSIRIAVGLWASRQVKSTSDYIVAGRRLPIYIAAASIMATWFAAGTLMGATSMGYQYGFQGVIFDPFGASMCLFLTGFLFTRVMRRARYLTVVDFFSRRFGVSMSVVASVLQLITYLVWTGAQIVAGGNIVHALLPSVPVPAAMIIVAGIVTVYTTLGGMLADTLLDFMQMFLTAGGVTLIFAGMVAAIGGFDDLFAAGSSTLYVSNAFSMAPIPGEGYLGYQGSTGWFYWVAAWMAVGLGSVPTQDLFQRSMSAKNEATAVWGTYFAGFLYLFFGTMSPLIGIAMFKLNPNIAPENTEFLLVSAAFEHLHPVLTALFIAALSSALMSTSDSALLAGAAVFTENLMPLWVKNMTDEVKLRWVRIMVVVIGVVAVTIALTAATIYRLGVLAWSILLVGLFTPFLFGMYWKKANGYGALAAFIGGFLSWVVFSLLYYPGTLAACAGDTDCGFWDAIYVASTPAFVVSVISMVVVALATQKVNKPLPITDVDGKPLDVSLKLGILPLKHALRAKDDVELDAPAASRTPAGD
ncbi:MAG TPA: sodium:solute symporter family protein [Anaerolineaceae bacterium]|nr:sodium:solute symporter family protein [Anaerolineaceae bacterium]